MVGYSVSKLDWKLFRERISGWQEAYMEKLCGEYIALLSGDGNASEKFWALDERIKKDKRDKGVRIRMEKQNVPYDIVSLIVEGAITQDDIADFSDELRERVSYILENL